MTPTPEPPAHLVGKDDLKLLSYVWYCGDESCDCTQPVICWQWRERAGRSYRYQREAIWEGAFRSRDGGGYETEPEPELAEACKRLGVTQ